MNMFQIASWIRIALGSAAGAGFLKSLGADPQSIANATTSTSTSGVLLSTFGIVLSLTWAWWSNHSSQILAKANQIKATAAVK
jgi:hypothetical protein